MGSAMAGAAIAIAGMRRRSPVGAAMVASGSALLLRGASGYCPATALAQSRGRADTREALAGSRGVVVDEAATINRPIEEIYRIWRELTTLPRYVDALVSVQVLDDKHSHWVASGPGGRKVEWDAEIINEVPNQLIGWRTTGHADVVSAGSVRFVPARRGTETQINVRLQYDAPGGKTGAALAWLFGREPAQKIREFLRRFKAELEAGEVPTAEGQPRGRQSILNYQ
jgi:uncharacterized membrane protein